MAKIFVEEGLVCEVVSVSVYWEWAFVEVLGFFIPLEIIEVGNEALLSSNHSENSSPRM